MLVYGNYHSTTVASYPLHGQGSYIRGAHARDVRATRPPPRPLAAAVCASNGATLVAVTACDRRLPAGSHPFPAFLRRRGADVELDSRDAEGVVQDDRVESDMHVAHGERDGFNQGFLFIVLDVDYAPDAYGQVGDDGDHREGEVGLDAAVVIPNLQ